MNFLDSEIVQQEMKDIEILQNKVYSNVFTFPNMNDKDKIEHIECLEELIGKQQIFYKRLSLSNDPKAKEMKKNGKQKRKKKDERLRNIKYYRQRNKPKET